MRLAQLYLRSRLTPRALACLTIVAALSWYWVSSMNRRQFGPEMVELLLVLTMTPIALATVLGVSVRSPFGDVEQTVSFPLPALRLGHLGGLLAWGGVGMLAVAASWPAQGAEWSLGEWSLFRNLAGFTGLALLGARLLGSGLSWLVPLAYGGLALMIGGDDGKVARWAWSVRPTTDEGSTVMAVCVLLLGLGVAGWLGSRDPTGESA